MDIIYRSAEGDSFRILVFDRNGVNVPRNFQQTSKKNENHGLHKLEKTPALCLISVINCSKNPSKKIFIKKIN